MLEGLPPIVGTNPTVLILGSMPGPESLRLRQYYAYQRNAFWPIMFAILGEEYSPDYGARIALIERSRVALWDVLYRCERDGALDSDIKNPVANDISGFLNLNPTIELVALNGGKAYNEFAKLKIDTCASVRLPSTSPAFAAKSSSDKLAVWKQELKPYLK